MKEGENKKAIFPDIKTIYAAKRNINQVINQTPLLQNLSLSDKYQANILLKREDLQKTRSYKIRGAYHKISLLSIEKQKRGVVCASAGNHAQGFAFTCHELNIKGKIFMPTTTPNQKIKQVRMYGKENVEIILTGDTFDEAQAEALKECQTKKLSFIPPFDDITIIEGQATMGLEILENSNDKIDYLFIPIGGGGLAAGLSTVFKQISPETKLIGVEPEGAASMKAAFKAGNVVRLENINTFVDGAAVKEVGKIPFEICKNNIETLVTVPEGKICTTILELYNEEALVVEPAGALSIAALDLFKEEIKGRNVVCIASGGNNDITRMEEIKERSLLYEKLKHYFLIRFPQRPGALKEFLVDVLGPTDDITHFEYHKKNNRSAGPALVGIAVKKPDNLSRIIEKLTEKKIKYEYLNDQSDLFHYII